MAHLFRCISIGFVLALFSQSTYTQSSSISSSSTSMVGSRRLVIEPALIRAGEAFTVTLINLSASERNLSSCIVSLSSSKLNEHVQSLVLRPEYKVIDGAVSHIVQRFSVQVETVRAESTSRPDLAAVNVLPGTRLDVSYSPVLIASINVTFGSNVPTSNGAAASILASSVQITLEPSIVLPPFVTPGQFLFTRDKTVSAPRQISKCIAVLPCTDSMHNVDLKCMYIRFQGCDYSYKSTTRS